MIISFVLSDSHTLNIMLRTFDMVVFLYTDIYIFIFFDMKKKKHKYETLQENNNQTQPTVIYA